jgi:toxin-antitoxin system PIN domain toxin
VNLLLYANIDGFPLHRKARTWWEERVNRGEPIALALPVVFGFVRIASNPRIFETPLPVSRATGRVRAWLEHAHVHVLHPGPRHLELAFALLDELGSAGNLTTDAQIAALAIEHQAELQSTDLDFARFPGLRWRNPLAT